MPIHNADISAVFDEIADLLEIQGDNPFRIRAYRNASRTIDDLAHELRESVEAGDDLTEIPGIGKDLAAKIQEIAKTGTTETLVKLRKQVPPGVVELLRIQGLGPKRVKILWKELKIETAKDLEQAARKGTIKELAGFGEKMEAQILQSLQIKTSDTQRFRRALVTPYADAMVSYLGKVPGVKKISLAGSYRRFKETVGDLDILVVADKKCPVMDRFVAYDEVQQVLAKGETKSSVILRSSIQVDLRVVPPESFGAALYYFTGSKAHNVAVRKIGQKKKLKINEYGVFRGTKQIAGKTEEDVFKSVGLPWIPPELREDRGEIDAAKEGTLPDLIEVKDIKGDLHCHSTWSDGQNSIEEMALAAKARGFEYIAMTDHSKRLTVANGLNEERLKQQMDEIDELNDHLKGITILKGSEVDILENGDLDLSDEVLERLDLVVASVHSKFGLSREKQMARILRAMDHPYFSILGHPTGRLILAREPYDVDVEKIIEHAKQRGCFLELNANPQRLDLDDVYCRMAAASGVLISIDSDAHGAGDFENRVHGVGQARRAWLEKGDVLNTRDLKSLKVLLKPTMGR